MARVLADKDCKCSGCGDDIPKGKPITLQRDGNKSSILCSRCDPPAMDVARVHVRVHPKTSFVAKKRQKK